MKKLCTVFICMFFLLSAGVNTAGALPKDGKVVAGSSDISQFNNKTTHIKQTTDKSIINWQEYSIGKDEKVQYFQPASTSVSLNRVTGSNPSLIYGQLFANGKIYLINPSGIVFGEGAQVNVGGLVASSLNMLDSDFLAGNYIFANDGKAGSVINKGSINADGGIVALLAPKVSNEGTITANGGSVVLGAGNQVTLDFNGDGLISYTIDKGAVDALAENKGLIKADGGLVVMTAKAADSLTSAVVNNSGVIEARTLQDKGGRILLLSDINNGTTVVGGTLDASAPNGGDGGFIETSAANVKVNDGAFITTVAPQGKTGTWLIDPVDFNIETGGDITGTQLSTNLGTTSVAILSSGGTTGTEGNVNVNEDVSWNANTTLTLEAYNNVNINADITATGNTAGLVITPNTGIVGGSFYLNNGAVITLTGLTPSLIIAGNSYTVINEASGGVTALQNMNGNLDGYYVLGSNIDASATSGWSSGFDPVGSSGTAFTGQFEGLGHTVTDLTVNRPTENYVGLFGVTGSGSVVGDVELIDSNISGNSYVGGLVGNNLGGTITGSNTTGTVTGTSYVGGLVGNNLGGTITASNTAGSVTGTNYVSGLVGQNTGSIANSYTTAAITKANITTPFNWTPYIYAAGIVAIGVVVGVVGIYYLENLQSGQVNPIIDRPFNEGLRLPSFLNFIFDANSGD